ARLAHELATRSGDRGNPRMAVYADVAIAEVLRNLGELGAAETVIKRAEGEAQMASDKVVVWLKQAVIFSDEEHFALTTEPLQRALAIEMWSAAPRPPIMQALWLNLAVVDRRSGDFAGSLAKIEIAHDLGVDDMSYYHARERTFLAAGRIPEASKALALAEQSQVTGEWAYVLALERARIAASMGDVAAAIAADQRAIDTVNELASHAGELAPSLVAAFREAHLHLIGLFASQGRFADALEVVARLDAEALLDSQATASEDPPVAGAGRYAETRRPSSRTSGEEILRAWDGRTLVVAVPDGKRLWRLLIRDRS